MAVGCVRGPPPRLGKALPVRPRALALAGLLRRDIVGTTPGAHLPTPPSMLPVIPALLLETEASQARRRKSDLASSSPVVLAASLVAEQAFNCRPDRIVVTTSARQDVSWGHVLCTRRRAESEQEPGALDIRELHEFPKQVGLVSGLGFNQVGVTYGHFEERRSHAAPEAGCRTRRPGPRRRRRVAHPLQQR